MSTVIAGHVATLIPQLYIVSSHYQPEITMSAPKTRQQLNDGTTAMVRRERKDDPPTHEGMLLLYLFTEISLQSLMGTHNLVVRTQQYSDVLPSIIRLYST